MKTVVLKFGGTSVGSIDRIKNVCKIIASYKKKKYKVVVVSSAMSGVTNDLVNKSKLISNNFDLAEYDALVSTGEQVSCALIAGRLKHIGLKSRSWLSWQLPIVTEGNYSSARINKININELNKYIKRGGIPIVTGFQGINKNFRITTIGRSGSDATAIMLAKYIKADECIIYTDVEGVYTTDPRQHKKAKKIKKIFYDEMLEMASLGSKVMQPTSIQDAKMNYHLIFLIDASIPVILAPNLHIGSESNPPPQPISKILIPDKGLGLFLVLNCSIIFSLIYLILIGLNLCKGLNFPWGSHHSSAIFENFSISFLFTLLM